MARQKQTQPSRKPDSREKCLTDIHGQDDITTGGLPRGRPTLVCDEASFGMTPRQGSEMEPASAEFWKLRLYVAGATPRAIRALENLQKICEERSRQMQHRSHRPTEESKVGSWPSDSGRANPRAQAAGVGSTDHWRPLGYRAGPGGPGPSTARELQRRTNLTRPRPGTGLGPRATCSRRLRPKSDSSRSGAESSTRRDRGSMTGFSPWRSLRKFLGNLPGLSHY